MSKFNAGQSFADGDTVTGAKLNNIAGLLDIYTGLISEQTAMSATVSTADQLLIADVDNGDSGAANRVTVQKLLNDTLTNGTFTGVNLTGNLNVAQLSTLGTISSTTGTIQTLTSSTANISQGSAIFTQGTIGTFNSTTPTFLGAITASTNTINIGSGQIVKDATGNVGVGTTSPSALLHVSGSGSTAVKINGGTSANQGPFIKFQKNSTDTLILGVASVILGGGSTSNDSMIYTEGTNNTIFYGNAAERLRIDSSGNVGIGIASPAKRLHVVGSTTTVGATQLELEGSENGYGAGINFSSRTTAGGTLVTMAKITADGESGWTTTLAQQNSGLRFSTTASGVTAERLRIDSSGGVTIAGLAGSGSRAVNASAAGLLSAASDASLKEEVVGAHIAGLDEILQIHPKMYRWKDDIANRGDEASVELGFIANDVAPIIPSAAPMGNDGLYGFYDRSITAALVKAIQELKAKNDSLESRLQALEAK